MTTRLKKIAAQGLPSRHKPKEHADLAPKTPATTLCWLGGWAKALIDRRGAPVMTPEMIHRMRDGIAENYQASDRLALVLDSSPLKLQARRNYALENFEAFLSYEAALAWLIHH